MDGEEIRQRKAGSSQEAEQAKTVEGAAESDATAAEGQSWSQIPK